MSWKLWRVPLVLSRCSVRRSYSSSSRAAVPWCTSGPLDIQGRIPAAPYDAAPLAGSVSKAEAHLILHPAQYRRPSTTWPSQLNTCCPLLGELSSRAKQGGPLEGFKVSFSAGDPDLPLPPAPPASTGEWDAKLNDNNCVPSDQAREDELYWLYAYAMPGHFVKWPEPISLRTLPSGDRLRNELTQMWRKAHDTYETHIYVCTHGMHDCRCGVAGSAVYDALRDAVEKHRNQCLQEGSQPARNIRVFPISHVGGHKWAACGIVYPHGDWYGNLRTTDTPLLIRAGLAPSSSRHDLDDLRERLVVWPRWRGRLGMDQSEQLEHMDAWGPPIIHTANLTPQRRQGSSTAESLNATSTFKEQEKSVQAQLNASPNIVPLRYHSYDGVWYDVEGKIGESLMEVAKKYDLPGIEATCDGGLECATCHAYLCDANPDNPEGRGEVNKAPTWSEEQMSEEEDDMLEYAPFRKASSRLTCQIRVTRELSDWMKQGGRVELDRY